MKEKLLIFGAILSVLLLIFVTSKNFNTTLPTGNVILEAKEYQEVKLNFKNYKYNLEPNELKVNIPVKMRVDLKTVVGCMRDVRIPAFKVAKYVSEKDNIIEFTPTKTGSFNIACSMNMGRGTFTVIN